MAKLKALAITILCMTAYFTVHANEAIRRGHDVPGGEICFLIAIPALVYFTWEEARRK